MSFFRNSIKVQFELEVKGVINHLVLSVYKHSKVRGFKPGRGRWIFKGDNNP
jgi:hypothetical protein